jgi:hypothetical protein
MLAHIDREDRLTRLLKNTVPLLEMPLSRGKFSSRVRKLLVDDQIFKIGNHISHPSRSDNLLPTAGCQPVMPFTPCPMLFAANCALQI